jgi:hypothetical protein
MTLVGAVTNILLRRVTEKEAKQFALDNYGVLATYIRQRQIEGIFAAKQNKTEKNETNNRKLHYKRSK